MSNFPPGQPCPGCGQPVVGRASQARWCSNQCRNRFYAEAGKDKVKSLVRARDPLPCANPFCDQLVPDFNGREVCDRACGWVVRAYRHFGFGAAVSAAINNGQLSATRVYFVPCVDCGVVACTRTRRKGQVVCKSCRRERDRRRDAIKNHRKRGVSTPLSVHDIAKRDGTRCHICHKKVDLSLSGMSKWGPTIEHIICVSWDIEQANDPSQHVLAHRHCNVSRHNKKPSQMVLPLGA